MSQSSFTYPIVRVQQDTGAHARYLDLAVCTSGGNPWPPGWCLGKYSGDRNVLGEDSVVYENSWQSYAECFKNCRGCDSDKPYRQEFNFKEDFLDFQFRIPGNWQYGFRTDTNPDPDPDPLLPHDFRFRWWVSVAPVGCRFIPHNPFDNEIPGLFVPKYFTGVSPSGEVYQNVRFEIAEAFKDALCADSFLEDHPSLTGFFTLDVYDPNLPEPYTIYSPMFAFYCESCNESKIKIQGKYPNKDFYGNIYTAPATSVGTTPFTYNNVRRWPGELMQMGTANNRTLDDNKNTKSETSDDLYRGRVFGIPLYEVENLKVNVKGLDVFINDSEYNNVGGFQKNQEIGSLWYPEFTGEKNFGYGINNPLKDCS